MNNKNKQTRSREWHGGKGWRARPVDKTKYDENYDRIFGKKDQKEKTDEQQ